MVNKKILIIGGIIVLAIVIASSLFLIFTKEMRVSCTKEAKICPDGTGVGRNPDLNCEFDSCPEECITAGKAYYPGTEKCCGDLKSIFGSELEDGTCWCTEEDNDCAGAPICAPCGNGECEEQYGEDRCNCPEDCE